jgi:ribosome-binding protein aMBF1 (putative translation factor)
LKLDHYPIAACRPDRHIPSLRGSAHVSAKARHTRGSSQEELVHAAGLDRSYVSGLVRGEFNVSVVALAKLARVAGVQLTVLLDSE